MNMFEEAAALDGMIRMRSMSQIEAARLLGVSQSYIANKLRILKLSPDIQKRIVNAGLSERHARALLRLKNSEAQRDALDKIIEMGLTVTESEAVVDLVVMTEIPYTFGRESRIKSIDSFIDAIRAAIKTVRSTGAYAQSKISYKSNKIYISIILDENGKM